MAYDFVDDFIFSGPHTPTTEAVIEEYRKYADCTPTMKNPSKVLGMEISRNWEDCTISLTLSKKATELMETIEKFGLIERFNLSIEKTIDVPLTSNNVHIGDLAFEDGTVKEDLCTLCTSEEITQYLTIVGGLIWQQGLRWDMIFSILYCTWATHKPRLHHLKMATKASIYCYQTRETNALVLGGKDPLEVLTYTDMSLNTGPQGRSVIAYGTRLGKRAGLICGKAKASVDVVLSTFEGEMEGSLIGGENNERISQKFSIGGLTEAFKQAAATTNVLLELEQVPEKREVYGDNEAMINFVNGTAQGKAMRHGSLRLWYMRQQVDRGYELYWMSGKNICANPMTKAVFQDEHRRYVFDVMGHGLRSEGGNERRSEGTTSLNKSVVDGDVKEE
jgi:hypothetical protein